MRRPLSPDQIAEVHALHAAGHTLTEIARRFGLTWQGVAYHTRPHVRERMQRRAREFQQSMRTA